MSYGFGDAKTLIIDRSEDRGTRCQCVLYDELSSFERSDRTVECEWLDRIVEQLHKIDLMGIILPSCMEEREDIASYVSQHPQLMDKIEETAKIVLDEFRSDAFVFLELYTDPEIEERHLCIFIRQHNYSDDIMERIDRVRENAPYEPFVTTDFQPPFKG
ncbi:MAG: hypothetical protein DRP63_03930 [Planctomycetota bacterium]|nr:MAG: hypothetical protein DRP63_03930 [Planctomycetota bacterium]